MREIDLVALAGLLHDIGKFGQRAEIELKDSVYKPYDYKYNHARYSAQILRELNFNLGDELSDASTRHHNPNSDIEWILASADRMASGFEREEFKEYNENSDKEDFKKQRLWYLFDDDKRYKIDTLNSNNIFPQDNNAVTNEYKELWSKFKDDLKEIKEKGTSIIDSFTIDFILKKYTTFIPSSTSFKIQNYTPVKANIPLYEHSKATAIFASVIYKLYKNKNKNILNYYKHEVCDIEQNDMLLINGDFFGIQKFIFNSVPSSKASKILRAKSAYIQILTKIIAFYIVEELELSYQSIISTNAGKFEILGVNDDRTKETLKRVQKELDEFFIEKYFGETGLGISFAGCSLADFIENGRYKKDLRKRLEIEVEKTKFKKFDLTHIEPVLKNDEDITNPTLCPLCNTRKIVDKYCIDCQTFVKLGTNLANERYFTISKNSGQTPIFGSFYINFSDKVERMDNAISIYDIANDEEFKGYAKWELSSYVKKNDSSVETFKELAEQSVKDGKTDEKREHGVEAIMSLKGDVDNMGKYIKISQVTNSFARYNFFSRMMDYFFSVTASQMMKGKDLYTVFAGGDDIFVLGAWDEVIDFAKELRQEFMKFAEGSGLTLSVGMVMIKPNKPINFVADISEEALEDAKEYKPEQKEGKKEKDAITLFGQTIGWDEYLYDMVEDFKIIRDMALKYPDIFGTAFWYRLLEFCDMKENIDNDIKNALWKSKVSYMFKRNIIDKCKNEDFSEVIKQINENIEIYGKDFKMVISEFIYKRRKI
jgi:CRISPR-associated protein Csm1